MPSPSVSLTHAGRLNLATDKTITVPCPNHVSMNQNKCCSLRRHVRFPVSVFRSRVCQYSNPAAAPAAELQRILSNNATETPSTVAAFPTAPSALLHALPTVSESGSMLSFATSPSSFLKPAGDTATSHLSTQYLI